MADEGQGVRVTAPPAPAKGEDVLPWATALMRWLRREMPSFGSGLTTEYGPGRMVRTGASSYTHHPFKVADASTQGESGGHFITMRPGFVAAQGCTDQVPIWAGDGTINVFPLVSQAVPYDSTLVLIDVEYDADEVWQSTEIRLENGASFSTTDTYLNGYLLVATLARVTSPDGVRSVTITQGITASQSHTKCNIYHSWTATGQVPSVVGLNVIFPQLAADPSPEPSAPYVYYNTTSDVLRLWNGAAWSTL